MPDPVRHDALLSDEFPLNSGSGPTLRPSGMCSTRIASIDIGSNTLRLLIAQPATAADAIEPWEEICYAHRISRLGEGLHHSGRLGEAGMQRTLDALKAFKALIDKHHIEAGSIRAVATAAVREAENGEAFRKEVLAQTGIDIRIIGGDLEAALSLKGAASVLSPETREDMLLFDIGGGSTEFIRAHDGKVIDGISRKLGVVRLVEAHLKSDPPSAEDFRAMQASATEHLQQVEAFWQQRSAHRPRHLVGTAGTVTTLMAVQMEMATYDAHKINNARIDRAGFIALRDRLLAMTHEERLAIPAIEAGRADLIIAGLAIIEAIMERWQFDETISVDAGLLEGNWLAAIH